jgi:hypothetical protein
LAVRRSSFSLFWKATTVKRVYLILECDYGF